MLIEDRGTTVFGEKFDTLHARILSREVQTELIKEIRGGDAECETLAWTVTPSWTAAIMTEVDGGEDPYVCYLFMANGVTYYTPDQMGYANGLITEINRRMIAEKEKENG